MRQIPTPSEPLSTAARRPGGSEVSLDAINVPSRVLPARGTRRGARERACDIRGCAARNSASRHVVRTSDHPPRYPSTKHRRRRSRTRRKIRLRDRRYAFSRTSTPRAGSPSARRESTLTPRSRARSRRTATPAARDYRAPAPHEATVVSFEMAETRRPRSATSHPAPAPCVWRAIRTCPRSAKHAPHRGRRVQFEVRMLLWHCSPEVEGTPSSISPVRAEDSAIPSPTSVAIRRAASSRSVRRAEERRLASAAHRAPESLPSPDRGPRDTRVEKKMIADHASVPMREPGGDRRALVSFMPLSIPADSQLNLPSIRLPPCVTIAVGQRRGPRRH